jgi:squalene cyclase
LSDTETAPIDPDQLRFAIERAHRHLLAQARADGSFPDVTDVGPSFTAFPLIALHYAGCDLLPEQTAQVVAWLRREQRADGSFVAYPFAPTGELCATAAVWAALRSAGLDEGDDAVRRARAYVEAHGGLDAVGHALFTRTNFAALFVAMAGLLDPAALPLPSPGLLLNPPVQQFLRDRFDYLNVVVSMIAAGAIVDDLRRRKWEQAAHAAAARGSWRGQVEALFRTAALQIGGAVEALDDASAISFLAGYQNPNGSLDDTTLQTALLLAAYHALHLPREDERMARAADWLRGMLVRAPDGRAWFSCFSGDVWATALAGRALISSGTPLGDPALARTVDWLLKCQIVDERRVHSTSKRGAPKSGGWAFEGGNVSMPDCDDTGLVLATLGLAAEEEGRAPDARLADDLSARVLAATEKACAWLEGIQNPDGGWSAFDYWEGSKPRGPMYTSEVGLVADGLLDTLKNLLHPPLALGSPAWEDVTARVLYGLGESGYTADAPMVARAVAFLRTQQLEHGGWWGRWMVNYMPTTVCALVGLVAVGTPLDDPCVKRGVDFLLAHQNPDGGWGESEQTYADPSRAGTGPSMPPLTGMVIAALIECGQGRSQAVSRGIAYLVREQRPDGTWPNGDWLHAFFPPQSFYVYFLMPGLYTLEALGRYRALLASGEVDIGSRAERPVVEVVPSAPTGPARSADGAWSDAFLDGMRKVGDPPADELVRSLLAADATEPVNRLLATLLRSDDPVPDGLPPAARAYFDNTATLPAWADAAQINVAERLFARAGWSMAAGLFCGALPQTYAAAKGAKVLLYSGRLDSDVRRRILETAQFIFDVTDVGGMSAQGRGVRTVQKVRLMHATLRHLTLAQARWDMDDGLPINQEDMAGTLMAFSCLILDALDRFEVESTRAEREAWMHLWKVVGAMLGIDPALLPRDEADGARLIEAMRRRHWAASPQGELLARSLVACMAEYLPGPGMDRLPCTLIRHLAGDACADLLAVPRGDWTALIVDGASELLGLFQREDRPRHIGQLLDRVSGDLMKAMIAVQRTGKQAPFRIPAALRTT